MIGEVKELFEFEKGINMLEQFILKMVKNGGFFIWSVLYLALFFQKTVCQLSRSSYTIYLIFGIVMLLVAYVYCYVLLPGQKRNFKIIMQRFDDLDKALNSYETSDGKKLSCVLRECAKTNKIPCPDRMLELEDALRSFRKYYWNWKELGVKADD